MPRKRDELTDRVWQLVEPTTYGYCNLIARLLTYISTKELVEIVRNMEGK